MTVEYNVYVNVTVMTISNLINVMVMTLSYNVFIV